MRECCRFGSRPLWLDFGRVYFDADGPGRGEEDRIQVDADYHDPARSTVSRMDRIACMENCHSKNVDCKTEAANDGAAAPPPFVGEEKGGNRDNNDDYARDAGGKEGGFGACKACLLKEQRVILRIESCVRRSPLKRERPCELDGINAAKLEEAH